VYDLKISRQMKNTLSKIWRFYVDGFKNMTTGRVLWLIILVKLFIMFAILRIFFFPNYLNEHTNDSSEKDDFVSTQLIDRGTELGDY
jgi:hypothetical protein